MKEEPQPYTEYIAEFSYYALKSKDGLNPIRCFGKYKDRRFALKIMLTDEIMTETQELVKEVLMDECLAWCKENYNGATRGKT